jgi:hypothetical protein
MVTPTPSVIIESVFCEKLSVGTCKEYSNRSVIDLPSITAESRTELAVLLNTELVHFS